MTLAAGAFGLVLASVCATAAGVEWDILQRSVVLFVAFDLVGGIMAMSMPPAMHRYRLGGRPLRPLAIAALHIHPFALAATIPEVAWLASLTAYAIALAAVLLASHAAQEYRAGLSLTLCALAVSSAAIWFPARGLEWFAAVYFLKLIGTFAAPIANEKV